MVNGKADPTRKSEALIRPQRQRSSPRARSFTSGNNITSPSTSPAVSPALTPPNKLAIPTTADSPNASPGVSPVNSTAGTLADILVNSPMKTSYFPDISTVEILSPCLSENNEHYQAKKVSKKQCPCAQSSGGESWLIPCSTCGQCWHNDCAGMKCQLFTKQVLNSLAKQWQCPWCYVCPIPRPGTHKSAKDGHILLSEAMNTSLIVNVAEKVAESIKSSIQPEYEQTVSSIQAQLKCLTDEISEFKNTTTAPNQHPLDPFTLPLPYEQHTISSECDEKPMYDDRLDYLSENDTSEILTHLRTCQDQELFKSKNGRSTLSYGVEYSYNGSKNKPSSEEIPTCFKKLIEKVAADYELPDNMLPNSVLVNHYPAKTCTKDPSSSLPKHSDDEIEIQPGSSIYTYSVGASRAIIFSAKFSEEAETHVVSHNSLYTMSRASQAWYTHRIMDVEKCDERFSVTLRTINPKCVRSVILIGDSNTKPILFGSGKGTVGESYPGRRVKAARIKDINPSNCCEYANVVIACGTNDLRTDSVDKTKPDAYIKQLVTSLREKVEDIKLLNPSSNIILMPVLPSRDPKMNEHICKFNGEVYSSEFRRRLQITMPPLYSFLDRKSMLALNLTRDSDSIHLGSKGICMFVRIIKEAIFRTGQGHHKTPRSGHARPP